MKRAKVGTDCGGDAAIRCAQAKGHAVLADIDGNSRIASDQDGNDYACDSIQAGLTQVFGWSDTGGVCGSLALSKAKSTDASVDDISVINVGSGAISLPSTAARTSTAP